MFEVGLLVFVCGAFGFGVGSGASVLGAGGGFIFSGCFSFEIAFSGLR